MKLLTPLLILFLSCKPADLDNTGDPFSDSYLTQNLVLCALGKGFCDPCVGVSNYISFNDTELIAFNGSGGGSAENAQIAKINATNFTKLASQPRPGVFLTSGCLVCGKIFATAYTPVNVDGAIIPFGPGSGVGGVFNSYHNMFSPAF